ncbi:hypothetical protein Pla52o_54750 [Novipirellula galeiformis]|uniref:Uncharacterized protein n=1 Tax=Novipirellula galeiformis TaxID=2528004 RepID=A0A5C6C0V0_9BACT|nr:hypothetical protein [Novipirellula galeiformis]TWU17136.1 hypothetical protein Pla52o_54750 [Novipirellula galeiformis]
MTPRTQWLMIAGLAVMALYFGDAFYRGWIEQPSQQLNAQYDALSSSIRDTKDEQGIAQKMGKRLTTYAARALPYDPQLARSLYQEWLLTLVDKHELRSASVDAAQPVVIELRSRTKKGKRHTIGHRIAYSLRGQASLAKFAEFMTEFREAGHLHKVRSLALNPTGKEGTLDINLAIEVLSLEASPNKDQLSDWQLAVDARPPRSVSDELVKRNLFARGFAKALYDIELKAITFDRLGTAQAWFRVDGRGTTKTVSLGQQVPIALHDISVVEIQSNKVLVNVNQQPHWISLGQSIGQVCSVPTES